MSVAIAHSRALAGMQAEPVTVEFHIANGQPSFNLVGLPDVEVRESRDRVRAAIQTAGFEFPYRKLTANLAPAEIPKELSLTTQNANIKQLSRIGGAICE